jgi:hypothetical protein
MPVRDPNRPFGQYPVIGLICQRAAKPPMSKFTQPSSRYPQNPQNPALTKLLGLW